MKKAGRWSNVHCKVTYGFGDTQYGLCLCFALNHRSVTLTYPLAALFKFLYRTAER